MIKVRSQIFETNSSSTHSLTFCRSDEFERWKNGELLLDAENTGGFIPIPEISQDELKLAKECWEECRSYPKWDKLSHADRVAIYFELEKERSIYSYNTYYTYNNDSNFYKSEYVSDHGDKVVAFGHYGYDG